VLELNLPATDWLRRDLTVTRLHDGMFSVSAWMPLSTAKIAFATSEAISLTSRTRKSLLLHVGDACFDVSWSEARQIADRFELPFPVLPAMAGTSLPSPSAPAMAGAFSRT